MFQRNVLIIKYFCININLEVTKKNERSDMDKFCLNVHFTVSIINLLQNQI